jgi:hypothetical protein
MPTNQDQNLAPFLKIYKGMKVIITQNIYPKTIILKETIGYVQSILLTKSHWIQHDNLLHPPINVLINFNEFIQKHEMLQNINLKGLPKNVIPIAPIIRNFQYHHFIQGSNTSKTFNISCCQLPLASYFCLTTFKTQGQTFEDLVINLH